MDELVAFVTSVSGSGMRLAVPLVVAALGECLVQRAGLINIGLEGMMLVGAFAGFVAGHYLGSPIAGVAAAGLAGLLMAAVFGIASIRFRADQIVVGTAINILALGLTTTAYQSLFGKTGSDATAAVFTEMNIPVLSRLPFIGEVFFSHNLFVYAVLPLTMCVWVWMSRTRKGIELVALGENPRAADTAGIPVNRHRFLYVLAGGVLGGVAGSYLTLAHSNAFVENMTAGRGFIAIAIVILGKWRPWGILMASVFFGMADALQFSLQALAPTGGNGIADKVILVLSNVPYQFVQMVPYLLTIAVLAGFIGGAKAPKTLGQAYVRE